MVQLPGGIFFRGTWHILFQEDEGQHASVVAALLSVPLLLAPSSSIFRRHSRTSCHLTHMSWAKNSSFQGFSDRISSQPAATGPALHKSSTAPGAFEAFVPASQRLCNTSQISVSRCHSHSLSEVILWKTFALRNGYFYLLLKELMACLPFTIFMAQLFFYGNTLKFARGDFLTLTQLNFIDFLACNFANFCAQESPPIFKYHS